MIEQPRHLITNEMINSLSDQESIIFYMIVEQEHSYYDICQIRSIRYQDVSDMVSSICRKLYIWRRRPEILRKAWRDSLEYHKHKKNDGPEGPS